MHVKSNHTYDIKCHCDSIIKNSNPEVAYYFSRIPDRQEVTDISKLDGIRSKSLSLTSICSFQRQTLTPPWVGLKASKSGWSLGQRIWHWYSFHVYYDWYLPHTRKQHFIVQIYHAKSFKMKSVSQFFIKIFIKTLKSVVQFNVHKTLLSENCYFLRLYYRKEISLY